MTTELKLLELVPDTNAGKCLRFCFGELHLSLEETSNALYDASKIAQAIDLLTNGRITSEGVGDS